MKRNILIIVVFLARSVLKTRPIGLLIINVEALGIGINSVYGTQKSIGLGLSIFFQFTYFPVYLPHI